MAWLQLSTHASRLLQVVRTAATVERTSHLSLLNAAFSAQHCFSRLFICTAVNAFECTIVFDPIKNDKCCTTWARLSNMHSLLLLWMTVSVADATSSVFKAHAQALIILVTGKLQSFASEVGSFMHRVLLISVWLLSRTRWVGCCPIYSCGVHLEPERNPSVTALELS